MSKHYEIRADYDAQSIVVYQAYTPQIALPALKAQKFVTPFSLNRMTWIKPSFLWMMERSNWGQKSNQECILAVRIKRSSWDKALSLAALTHFEKGVYQNTDDWRSEFHAAPVIVQWDPERSIRGAHLAYESIQVGVGRKLIREYVSDWIISIEDMTPTVRKMHALLRSKQADKATAFLPTERVYPVRPETAKRIGLSVG